VVKNVAGFDLTSLAVGSFGAFGLITSAFVRLSAVPTTDETLTASAPRKVLIDGALSILDCGLTPSAMELFTHPGSREWVLAVRSCGSAAAVESDRQKMSERAQDLSFRSLTKAEASALWEESRGALAGHSTTIRAGCLPTEVEQMLDLAESELGDSSNISVSVAAGVARWSCDATIDQIQSLRNAAALNRWPVTLERAPWNVLTAVGHYGAYRDGVGRLVASLRRVFDGDNRLMIPLGDNE